MKLLAGFMVVAFLAVVWYAIKCMVLLMVFAVRAGILVAQAGLELRRRQLAARPTPPPPAVEGSITARSRDVTSH